MIRSKAAPWVLQMTLAGWAVLELGLRVRERLRGKGRRRPRSRHARADCHPLGTTIAVAAVTPSRATAMRISGPYRAGGLIVMWLGLAIRVWAIAVLGREFRTMVEVDSGQAVISNRTAGSVTPPTAACS